VIWEYALFLQQDALARETFDLVSQNPGISGIGIARQLDKNRNLVQEALSSLRERQLVLGFDSFALTELGFAVKFLR